MRHDITHKRIAAIREMASLGLYGSQIARALGMKASYVRILASQNHISLTKNRMETGLRRAIRAGYASGKSPREIAGETGASVATVSVLACNMGLTRGHRPDPAKWRRGFIVPDHMMDDYRELRRLGCTIKEAGYHLGLIERKNQTPTHSREGPFMAASA